MVQSHKQRQNTQHVECFVYAHKSEYAPPSWFITIFCVSFHSTHADKMIYVLSQPAS